MIPAIGKRVIQSTMHQTSTGAVIKSMMSKAGASTNRFTKHMARSIKGKSMPMGYGPRGVIGGTSDFVHALSTAPLPLLNRNVKQLAHATVSSKTSLAAQAIVGASAMTAISMMSGGIGRAEDIMAQRYMRDSRYSSRLLAQTNLGQSMTGSKISIGNHTGLSLAMSRGRHG